MKIESTATRISFSNQGDILFELNWDEVQRVSAHRRHLLDEDTPHVSIEIVPQRLSDETQWNLEHYGIDAKFSHAENPDEWDWRREWDLWMPVLTERVPGFSEQKARSVINLPEDEEDPSIYFLLNDLKFDHGEKPEQDDDEELANWFDSTAEKLEKNIESIAQRPEPERTFLLIHEWWCEIGNGGFHQYFGNSAGDRHRLLRVSLETIQNQEAVELLEQACAEFPNGSPSPDTKARQAQLEAMDESVVERFDILDERWSEIEELVNRELRRYYESN